MRKGRLPSFTDKKTEARKENNLPRGTELMSNISLKDERVRPRGKLLKLPQSFLTRETSLNIVHF